MLAASSYLRITAALAASALATLFAATGFAQSINLSLNVFYATPTNAASGGTWELVAKSTPGTTFGISGLSTLISDINSPTIEGPRGIVNGSTTAGFQIVSDVARPADDTIPRPAYHEITVAQIPVFPVPPGKEESYFYGVGTLTNGSPDFAGKPAGSNSIGPTFTSLTTPQGIAWATGDAFGDAVWNTAARLLSGTFAAGVTPGFISGSTGNVFTSLPVNNTTLGNEVLASTITTIVRTNFIASSADYNHDGIVDGADYVVWRKTLGNVAAPPGSGADGNADGTVNMADYTLWRSHYGNPSGAGSGGDLSTNSVPEPTGCILLTIGAVLATAPRRSRCQL